MFLREPRFIDREKELEYLKNFCSKSRALPLYIFGPEGCGKTRLLREFVETFNKYFDEDGFAIYIDALERESIENAIKTSSTIRITVNIVSMLVEKFMGFNVGEVLANNISNLLEKTVGRERLKDKYVFIAIDDVTRAIGLDKIEWYVKWLYELRWKMEREYRPRSINFIVTTSEGISLDIVSKHRHTYPVLIWNLDKNGFKKLFRELNPPENIDFKQIWRMFGGNPGKLIELARQFEWNIDEMNRIYERRIKKIIDKIFRENLVDELKTILKDIDMADKIKTEKMGRLINILIDLNLIIYKYWPTIFGEDIVMDKEIGIGKYYAWQTPIYKEIVEKQIDVN